MPLYFVLEPGRCLLWASADGCSIPNRIACSFFARVVEAKVIGFPGAQPPGLPVRLVADFAARAVLDELEERLGEAAMLAELRPKCDDFARHGDLHPLRKPLWVPIFSAPGMIHWLGFWRFVKHFRHWLPCRTKSTGPFSMPQIVHCRR
jgi:hypothetical protein